MTIDDKNLAEVLDQAEHWAMGLIAAIAWVNYLERTDDRFGLEVSARVREGESRDELRGIVRSICRKTRQSPVTLRTLNSWPDLAAQEIVTAAVKGWLIGQCPAANAWLRDVRLIVKFEGIDQPYCQEAKPNLRTLMKEQVSGHRVHRQRSLGGVDEMLN